MIVHRLVKRLAARLEDGGRGKREGRVNRSFANVTLMVPLADNVGNSRSDHPGPPSYLPAENLGNHSHASNANAADIY